MKTLRRIPWQEPEHSRFDRDTSSGSQLRVALGDPWGHALAIVHRLSEVDDIELVVVTDPSEAAPARLLPALTSDGAVVCDDPLELAQRLAPSLFGDGESMPGQLSARERSTRLRSELIDAVYRLGALDDQGAYEAAHHDLADDVDRWNDLLGQRRFLGGESPDFSDILLFTFSVRLDPVYYELFKASIGLLCDFEHLQNHARDLWERPAFFGTTDFDAIKAEHYLHEPVTNAKRIVPLGGIPDLDAPHFREALFDSVAGAGVGEDQDKSRGEGEWVRPESELRHWIRPDADARFPAEPGRYHLYVAYNCPWSHRALLARAVKGLEDVVGASIAYFRRHPDHGWQFNPDIPGCTADLAGGRDFVEELYLSIGSDERSVPVLWDTVEETIVNNESAEILRIFNGAFDAFAERDIDLYPAGARAEIDRINAAVYQRINNGAYKAGFSSSQQAYERAFARYFRALEWLEQLLAERDWIADTPAPTEADLRLFPTLFRHDEVYYSRFKLNARRIASMPRLADWLERMLDLPGVRQASNLDHSRNGYFGRSGNEIVPAGPSALGLSRSQFTEAVWLGDAARDD